MIKLTLCNGVVGAAAGVMHRSGRLTKPVDFFTYDTKRRL